MAASEEPQTSLESEVVNEPQTLETKVEETLASTEAQRVSESQFSVEESSGANAEISSPLEAGEGSGKTLEDATEFMEKGSEAMKAADYAEAAECFSHAVEIRVGHYGELAPECSSAYYRYGCALLYKAQEETDPLGSVPKKESVAKGESSTASVVGDTKKDVDSGHKDGEPSEDAGKKDQVEEDDDGGDDDEASDGDDLAEPDEDESDLDLAWKMLDLARAIVEKNPKDTLEKVDILSALGEVALEREDIETSFSDYSNALSILQRLDEPDSRHIAELNFRICLVLEVGSKPEEAMPYCEKAISICKARLQRLMDEVKSSTVPAAIVEGDNQEAAQLEGGSDADSSKEAEIETLTGLSSELEKKLEDLQQQVLNPTSILPEVLKMISAKAAAGNGKNESSSSAVSSSQMATNSSGGAFDSPTLSTAHTNGNIDGAVKHLGVVGRGVKRVNMSSGSAESSTPMKKPAVEKGEGSS